jgi:hypothetical protein
MGFWSELGKAMTEGDRGVQQSRNGSGDLAEVRNALTEDDQGFGRRGERGQGPLMRALTEDGQGFDLPSNGAVSALVGALTEDDRGVPSREPGIIGQTWASFREQVRDEISGAGQNFVDQLVSAFVDDYELPDLEGLNLNVDQMAERIQQTANVSRKKARKAAQGVKKEVDELRNRMKAKREERRVNNRQDGSALAGTEIVPAGSGEPKHRMGQGEVLTVRGQVVNEQPGPTAMDRVESLARLAWLLSNFGGGRPRLESGRRPLMLGDGDVIEGEARLLPPERNLLGYNEEEK